MWRRASGSEGRQLQIGDCRLRIEGGSGDRWGRAFSVIGYLLLRLGAGGFCSCGLTCLAVAVRRRMTVETTNSSTVLDRRYRSTVIAVATVERNRSTGVDRRYSAGYCLS